jgi:hypothetical protein
MLVRSPVLRVLAVLGLAISFAGVATTLTACKDDPTLKVTGIDPDKGDAEGGTYVRIQGNRFIADGAMNAKVYFGSHQGTVIRFASDSELIVEAPGGKVGDTVDVLILFEGGKIGQAEKKLVKAFTFTEKKPASTVNELDTSKTK